jgi:hypothetical protein
MQARGEMVFIIFCVAALFTTALSQWRALKRFVCQGKWMRTYTGLGLNLCISTCMFSGMSGSVRKHGAQCAALHAGKLAGLEVVRIIREPVAAALAYGLNLREDQTVGVRQ